MRRSEAVLPGGSGRLDAIPALHGEDDLQAVLASVVEAVAERLEVGAVVLNLYRAAWDDFQVTHMYGSEEASQALLGTTSSWRDWLPFLSDEHRRCGVYFVAAGSVDWYGHDAPTYVPPAPPRDSDDGSAWDSEDALFAVLERPGGRVLGILSVDEPLSARRPGDDEFRVLHGVAADAARAIEEAQSAARERHHHQALKSLLAVSSRFNSQLDPAEALTQMCGVIRDAFGFGRVAVALCDPVGELRRVATAGVELFEDPVVRNREELAALCVERFAREGCYLLDPSDPDVLPPDRPRYRSQRNGCGPLAWRDHMLVIPLASHAGRLLGYVWVDEPADRLLPADDTLHALRTLANQAAMAVEIAARAEALSASEDRNAAVLQAALDAFITIDQEGRIIAFNPAAERIFGHSSEQVLGRDMASLLIPERLRDRHQRGFAATSATHGESRLGRRLETWLLHADGRELPVELAVARTSTGGPVSYTAHIRDISERRRHEEQIIRLAHEDALTQLPNRAGLEHRLAQLAGTARRPLERLALLYVDLDDFKLINDSLGHAAGDELLKAVAARLTAAKREIDILARHGGDEFMLLLRHLGRRPEQAAKDCAQRIIDALQAPFTIGQAELWISASIGISILPGDAKQPDGLLKHATAAMYEAKTAGRGRSTVYRTGGPDPRRRLELSTRLRRALTSDAFELHYQPLVDLATMRTVCAEALLRWRDGDTLIPPAEFIPLAEETGLIEPIGDWVIREVCAQAAAWERHGFSPRLTFNLSPRQLLRPDLVGIIAGAIHRHGLAPGRLVAEITETALIRHAQSALAVLDALHQIGVSVAIDDFGAGYSSLSRLRELPVDILKIDRRFLSGVPRDPAATQTIQAILSLASGLGMTAVAEGIEHPDQLEFLRQRGCPLGQGFHLGRPAPANALPINAVDPAGAAL